MEFFIICIGVIVLGTTMAVLLTLIDKYKVDLFEFIYLVYTGQLKHHNAKLHLEKGDLVFINYRGKLRKAYIKHLFTYSNRVDVDFEDQSLNGAYNESMSFHFSRIYVPEYVNNATKILYGMED